MDTTAYARSVSDDNPMPEQQLGEDALEPQVPGEADDDDFEPL